MNSLSSAISSALGATPSVVATVGGGGAAMPAWAASAQALRTFITANYNQPNPHNQAVMSSPPTITASTTQPSGLTQEKRYSNNAPELRYYGGGNVAFATVYRRFPTATIAASGGNVGNGKQAIYWRVSAVHNGSKVSLRVLGGTVPYRFIVDGRYVSLAGTLTSTTSGTNYFQLDFGSAATRTIIVEGVQANAFDAIGGAPGDTISLVSAVPLRGIVLGDSFAESVGATVNGDGFAAVMGDMLGVYDMWSSGVGSTGYVADSSGTRYALPTRLSTDLDACIALGTVDMVVVAMGINDIGLSGIQAAAQSVFTTIRQKLPLAQVFVLGPFDTAAPSAPSANYTTCKAAIQAAMLAAGGGFKFIDMQGVSYTKSDATHPDTAGHKTLGDYVALQIKTALGA
jgi:lysophospholipase L1-like esterase